MNRTQKYRDQHKDLLGLGADLAAHLDPAALAADAEPARKVLSSLAGKLNVHLAMEDSVLYPSLQHHMDARVRSTAQRFQQEMGSIKDVFTEYLAHWPGAGTIQRNPAAFVRETEALLKVLQLRIAAEDSDLYTLADQAL